MPNKEAMAFISNKPVVSREVFDNLLPSIKARAFTITGIESANVLQRVRDRIAELPAGADWDKLKAEIVEDVSPYLVDPSADAETQAKQMEASERRANLLLRTHGFEAYQAASWEVMDRQRDVFPFWQYMTVQDENVREEHAALDGLVLPSNSLFWNDHYPPWDWGCRCQVVPIMEEEMQAVKDGESDYGRVLSERQEKKLEQDGALDLGNGHVINVSSPTASGKDGAFSWNPGDLRIPIEQLEQRYDPEVFKTFRSFASAQKIDDEGLTIWGWLNQSKDNSGKQTDIRISSQGMKTKPITSGDINAGKKAEIIAESLALIKEDSTFSDFGFRMLPPDMDDVKVGDRLDKSFRWNDGNNSEENIEGVSTIGIRGNPEKAMKDFAPAPSNGYFGRKVALVRGSRVGSGEDVGETIIADADVVAIWDVGE